MRDRGREGESVIEAGKGERVLEKRKVGDSGVEAEKDRKTDGEREGER